MKKHVILAVFLLTLLTPIFAQNVVNTSITIFTANDTYVFNTNNAGQGGNTTDNFANSTTVVINAQDSGNANANMDSFFKFNNSAAQRRVISSLKFAADLTVVNCGTPRTKPLKFILNDTWDQKIITGQNRPSETGAVTIDGGWVLSANGVSSSAQLLDTNIQANSELLQDLYNDSFSTIIADGTLGGGSCGAATSTTHTVVSSEGDASDSARWNISLSDYLTASILGTDVSNTWFDFESGRASSSFFQEADFRYDAGTNTLTPIALASRYSTENNAQNTLEQVTCGSVAPFSGSQITSLNVPVTQRALICFNLSFAHNGRQFYGAIKVLNNTNIRSGVASEFDFFYAMYSPDYTIFSNVALNPTPAQGTRNLTVSWTTSQALTSRIRFRYQDPITNTFTSFVTVENLNVSSTLHSLQIDGSNIVGGAYYEYTLSGETVSGSTFYSNVLNFTAVTFQQQLPDVTEGIHIFVQNEYGDGTSGLCSIDGRAPVSTHPVAFDRICSFTGFGIGAHNITISATGFFTHNLTINVTVEPAFATVRLTPTDTCRRVATGTTSQQCEQNARGAIALLRSQNAINISAFYCQFDANECTGNSAGIERDLFGNIISNVTNICAYHGAFVGFACLDGFFPTGFPVNGTVAAGTVPTNSTGAVSAGTADFVSQLFGISSQNALAVIALIITLIFSMIVGVKTKDGFVTGIVFMGFVTLFLLMNWLPLWIWIIMIILSGALAAASAKRMFTPSG